MYDPTSIKGLSFPVWPLRIADLIGYSNTLKRQKELNCSRDHRRGGNGNTLVFLLPATHVLRLNSLLDGVSLCSL
jgi:hypothetical protein